MRRNPKITRTNLYDQLNIALEDMWDCGLDQMDWGLYWSGREMIAIRVNNATPASLGEVSIRDIIYLL